MPRIGVGGLLGVINLSPFMSPRRSTSVSAGWTHGSAELSEVGFLQVTVNTLKPHMQSRGVGSMRGGVDVRKIKCVNKVDD